MLKKTGNRNSGVEPETSHWCNPFCLGPLAFHREAVGDMVSLSRGCRHAVRTETKFDNGLVFSSRPLRIRERIRLRVDKSMTRWCGALRVGFTNVPPSSRSLPLPPFAMPNLTNQPGHWSALVHEHFCQAGSELEFWVSRGGTIYVTSDNSGRIRVLEGVHLHLPLWAMIDIYGQTCAISLIGSKKREMLHTRRSCPVPDHLTKPVDYQCGLMRPEANSDECMSRLDMEIPADEPSSMDCVVCMERRARITLPCGHRCLCHHCTSRVIQQFGTCPLCRWKIRDEYDVSQ